MPLVQEANFLVDLTVNGDPIRGAWDTLEGGDYATEPATYRAGGMAEAEPLVSTPTVSDVTISRAYDTDRDPSIERRLLESVGASCVVGRQVLDRNKLPVSGGQLTYVGVISRVDTPKHDSMGNAVTRLAVTITVRGKPNAPVAA